MLPETLGVGDEDDDGGNDCKGSSSPDSSSCNSEILVEDKGAVAFQRLAGKMRLEEPVSPSVRKKKLLGGAGCGVKFGSVRVHTHNLTLGDNPGGTAGPPVEMTWDPQDSLHYSTVDEFAIQEHGLEDSLVNHGGVHRMTPAQRQEIAAREHTAGSIRRIEIQIHEIRKERLKSRAEDLAEAEKKDAERKAKNMKHQQHGNEQGGRKKKFFGGFLKSFFVA